MRITSRVRARARVPWLQAVKTLVAIAISWIISLLLFSSEFPIFAAIAALLVVAPSVNQSVGKGIERSVGVILGVLLAWVASLFVPANSWTVLAIVSIAVVVCWAVRLAPMASNQVPISAMLMLALGASADPNLAFERIWETVIGSAVAFLVNVAIVPPAGHPRAERELRQLAIDVADRMDDIEEALRDGPKPGLLDEARQLRRQTPLVREAMHELEDTLVLNPRAKQLRPRIARDEQLLFTLTVLTNRVIGMSRTVSEHWDSSFADDPVVLQICSELARIAHDVRLLVARHVHEDAETASLPTLANPLLTAPISVAKPHPTHWIAIGALLEDVRQARESLTAGFSS